MLFVAVLGVFFFVILILFSFPRFSPIPYFPTNKKDLPLIVKALNLKDKQVILDLGAGDGAVIFAAAADAFKKGLNTKFAAIDINPVLVFIMHIRRLFHPNKGNIRIILGDLFKTDYEPASPELQRGELPTTIYLYVSPWYLDRIANHIISNLSGCRRIVSYFYPIPSLTKCERKIVGKNMIYLYKMY